jgi:hypothetical protein
MKGAKRATGTKKRKYPLLNQQPQDTHYISKEFKATPNTISI